MSYGNLLERARLGIPDPRCTINNARSLAQWTPIKIIILCVRVADRKFQNVRTTCVRGLLFVEGCC